MGTIIVDTRQQAGKHAEKHAELERIGYKLVRSKLPYGDYALMIPIAVDTKADIYELANCIDKEHERFRRECIDARDAGCKLWVLTINSHGVTDLASLSEWEEPMDHFRMRRGVSGNRDARRISGERLAKACITMRERYGVRFIFCEDEVQSAHIIDTLLNGGEWA